MPDLSRRRHPRREAGDDPRSLPQVVVEVEGSAGQELHLVASAKVRLIGALYRAAEIRA